MAIYSSEPKGGDSFKTAPAGTHQAVCVDVINRGIEKLEFDGKVSYKHRIQFVFEIDEEYQDDEGNKRRYIVTSKKYVNSLHKNAALRKDLVAWRGKDFTAEQLKGFDLETVLGANCMLSVIHREWEGNTYANISSIMPLAKKQEKMEPSGDYTRKCDRDDWVEPSMEIPGKDDAPSGDGQAKGEPVPAGDDDSDSDGLPF